MNEEKINISFQNRLKTFNREEILDLARERSGELSNLIKGLNNQCFGVNFKSFEDIDFEYFNYENKLKGYSLSLKYKQKDFYLLLLSFVFFLSNSFQKIESIKLYNTYVELYSRILENNWITTISTKEVEKIKQQHAVLLISGEYEIINLIDDVEFYRNFLSYNRDEVLFNEKQIYLMYSKMRNEFKIGRSKNPIIRKSQGNTFDPNIVLLKTWKGDSQLETKLKNIFHKRNVGGEWFKLNLQDLYELNKYVLEFNN